MDSNVDMLLLCHVDDDVDDEDGGPSQRNCQAATIIMVVVWREVGLLPLTLEKHFDGVPL